MGTPTPTKKWTSRMGGVVRRASTALISPRPATPDRDRESIRRERTSTSSDRDADDSGSIKGPGRSRSNTSLSAIRTARSVSPPPQPATVHHQPSPIAESPAREAAATTTVTEESSASTSRSGSAPNPPPAAVKSPLSQEVKLSTDPSSAAGPGAFTDDLDDLPQSEPIADPFARAANTSSSEDLGQGAESSGAEAEPEAGTAVGAGGEIEAVTTTQKSVTPEPEQPAPMEHVHVPIISESPGSMRPPSVVPTEPISQPHSHQPSAQGSIDALARQASQEQEEEVPTTTAKSAPIPIPQPRAPAMPEPDFRGARASSEPEPETPPSRQAYLDTYVSEHEGWSGPSHRDRDDGKNPMLMPTEAVARSLDSSDSSEIVPASRPLENPFGDPVVPRMAPKHGNGYLPPSEDTGPGVMMPTPIIPSNSKSSSNHPKFLSMPKSYGVDSDSDETQPLMRKAQRTSSSYTFNPTAPIPGRNTFEQHQSATPPRLRDNGWVEIHLPDSSVYYVNQTSRIVADVELRNERLYSAILSHLELEQHKDAMDSTPEGTELWLRDAGNAKRGFIPVRWWVNHRERSVVFDKAFDVAIKRKLLKKKKEDEDQLDLEYRYWAFVEAHPSHVVLQARAKQEAYEAINWAMTERLLPSQSPIPAPFSQDECATLLDLLNRFDNEQNRQVDTAIQTRTIARILLRVAQWRQQHFRPSKPLPKDVTAKTAKVPSYRRPFPRVILDFTISCLCLGIPYFFLDRSRDHRADEESGLRSAAPMFVIGACTCIMASVVLSASVTLLSLSGLDSIMRIAGFVAIISAVCSMASTLLAIFTIKADLERPPQVIGGEGLLMLSKRSVVMSLPVVFLLYSIIGFVTGVVLYSLRGASITDANLVRRPFNEYTRWTAAGALGAIAGMVTISILLFKR
ncbi:hypothetical protein AX15_005599 [Amanita polypyramis BW_CC]|nr:hypothetical protein AX15_005599 [Amanita polypyramis BW_CC]